MNWRTRPTGTMDTDHRGRPPAGPDTRAPDCQRPAAGVGGTEALAGRRRETAGWTGSRCRHGAGVARPSAPGHDLTALSFVAGARTCARPVSAPNAGAPASALTMRGSGPSCHDALWTPCDAVGRRGTATPGAADGAGQASAQHELPNTVRVIHGAVNHQPVPFAEAGEQLSGLWRVQVDEETYSPQTRPHPPSTVSWLPPQSETPREQDDLRPHARGRAARTFSDR